MLENPPLVVIKSIWQLFMRTYEVCLKFFASIILILTLLFTSAVQSLAFPENALQERLDVFINAKHAPGVAVALSLPGNKEAVVLSSGLASLERNIPMQHDMIFCFGSLAKIVTAMRIKAYISTGTLALKQDVRTFFPALSALKHPISVEHLLIHSGGFPAFFEIEELFANITKPWTNDELLQILSRVQLRFTPGSVQRYGNVGYYLLGHLLLQQGQHFHDFVAQTQAQPLNVSVVSDAKILPNKVVGYSKNLLNEVVAPTFMSKALFLGTGDLQGTVKDVLNLLSLWKNYQLVPAELLASHGEKLFEQPTVREFLNSRWGFFQGIELFLLKDGTALLGKSGIYPGYASYYIYDPRSTLSLVIACNQDTAGFELWQLALDMVRMGNAVGTK